jgi:tRNA(Ile)-lysidine synthase
VQADLKTRVLHYIQEHDMIRAGDRVGIGVSGGSDSIAIFRLIDELKSEMGIQIFVLHFNHELRGADSDMDEAFVRQLAAAHDLEFFGARKNVRAFAEYEGLNLEDAARHLRYQFFAEAVESKKLARVAIAHTADDQAETVLARLVRGTGPTGLSAIYPVKGHIARPLLEIRRAELREYLTSLGQNWREDASNLETTRLRAYLRHKILPILEAELQPAIVANLGRTAGLAREDENFWSAFIAERIGTLTKNENGRVGIRCTDLLHPLGSLLAGHVPENAGEDPQRILSRRMVRAMVAALPGTPRQLTAKHVEQVLHLADKCASGHRTEVPRAVAERSFDWIWFESFDRADSRGTPDARHASNSIQATFSHVIDWTSNSADIAITVPEIRKCLRLKVIDWVRNASETSFGAVIDGELLRPPLLLRSWRPGDSFRPQGRRRPLKLKQFLRERRVALRDRSGWPVLTSAGAVVWARGLPVAAEFSPRNDSRTAVLISEEAM